MSSPADRVAQQHRAGRSIVITLPCADWWTIGGAGPVAEIPTDAGGVTSDFVKKRPTSRTARTATPFRTTSTFSILDAPGGNGYPAPIGQGWTIIF